MSMTRYRIAAIAIVFISILFLPYWVYLPALLATMIVFPFFWEGIMLGYLIDVLYGRGIAGLSELISPMAFSALILLIILIPVRERLRIAP